MARRTRRPTVVWLPLDTTNKIQAAGGAAANSGDQQGGFGFSFLISAGGTPAGKTQMQAIVKDEPQNITGVTETLSDLEGSAYRLRRVVGKIFVQPPQISTLGNVNNPTSFMVTAGLIILRCDPTGVALSPVDSYNPQSLDSTRDPWIWRRTWMVSDQQQIAAINAATPDVKQLIFPSSNVNGYGGGVMDGPHVDAKTARVVSDEERLFLVVGGIGLDGSTQGDDSVMTVFGELRVLASMRKQSGNRRNASR